MDEHQVTRSRMSSSMRERIKRKTKTAAENLFKKIASGIGQSNEDSLSSSKRKSGGDSARIISPVNHAKTSSVRQNKSSVNRRVILNESDNSEVNTSIDVQSVNVSTSPENKLYSAEASRRNIYSDSKESDQSCAMPDVNNSDCINSKQKCHVNNVSITQVDDRNKGISTSNSLNGDSRHIYAIDGMRTRNIQKRVGCVFPVRNKSTGNDIKVPTKRSARTFCTKGSQRSKILQSIVEHCRLVDVRSEDRSQEARVIGGGEFIEINSDSLSDSLKLNEADQDGETVVSCIENDPSLDFIRPVEVKCEIVTDSSQDSGCVMSSQGSNIDQDSAIITNNRSTACHLAMESCQLCSDHFYPVDCPSITAALFLGQFGLVELSVFEEEQRKNASKNHKHRLTGGALRKMVRKNHRFFDDQCTESKADLTSRALKILTKCEKSSPKRSKDYRINEDYKDLSCKYTKEQVEQGNLTMCSATEELMQQCHTEMKSSPRTSRIYSKKMKCLDNSSINPNEKLSNLTSPKRTRRRMSQNNSKSSVDSTKNDSNLKSSDCLQEIRLNLSVEQAELLSYRYKEQMYKAPHMCTVCNVNDHDYCRRINNPRKSSYCIHKDPYLHFPRCHPKSATERRGDVSDSKFDYNRWVIGSSSFGSVKEIQESNAAESSGRSEDENLLHSRCNQIREERDIKSGTDDLRCIEVMFDSDSEPSDLRNEKNKRRIYFKIQNNIISQYFEEDPANSFIFGARGSEVLFEGKRNNVDNVALGASSTLVSDFEICDQKSDKNVEIELHAQEIILEEDGHNEIKMVDFEIQRESESVPGVAITSGKSKRKRVSKHRTYTSVTESETKHNDILDT